MISHSYLSISSEHGLAKSVSYGNLHVVLMKSGIAVSGQRVGET